MKIVLDENRLDLAKLFKGYGVEIGVATGYYSSEIIALGRVEKLYGVDPYVPHQGYRDYTRETTFDKLRNESHQRLEGHPNYEFIETYSTEASHRFKDNSLDFVYIDGDHSYEAVMDDIKTWFPKLKSGGVMAGDDYAESPRDRRFYDVIRAVDEYVETNSIPMLYLYSKQPTPTNWLFYKR